MATPKLSLEEKMRRDQMRAQGDSAKLRIEGKTVSDPKLSQRNTPITAAQMGGSVGGARQSRTEAIGRRPVFRSPTLAGQGLSMPGAPQGQPQALASGPAVSVPQQPAAGPAPGAGYGQAAMGLGGGGMALPQLSGLQQAQMAMGPQGANALRTYQPDMDGAPPPPGQQQPMTPPPIFQQQDPGSGLPRGYFDDFLAGDNRVGTTNVGTVQDWTDRGSSTPDQVLPDRYGGGGSTTPWDGDTGARGPSIPEQVLPERYGGPAPAPAGQTRDELFEQLLRDLMGMDTEAQRAAAEERSAAALSQAQADAQAQMSGLGFMGSGVSGAMNADIARQFGRDLTDQLLGIDQAAADRALGAGSLFLGDRELGIREEALRESRDLLEEILGGGGGGGGDGAPDLGAGEDGSVLDQAGLGDFVEQMFNPQDVSDPSEIPGYADGNAWLVPGTSGLYRGTDGNFYLVGGGGGLEQSNPNDGSQTQQNQDDQGGDYSTIDSIFDMLGVGDMIRSMRD